MSEETRMNVELEESVSRTYTKVAEIRPKNTSRAYANKQKEFTQWCDEKGAAFNALTRYTATGPKLHLFLEERVIGRAKRRKGQEGRAQTIGRATVSGYVAAMVDLWRQQQRMEINNHPSPRNDAVTLLLKVTEYEEDDRRRKNFDDRGADTMLDGYTTTEQIGKIAAFFWSHSREPGTNLRNLLAFLFSHYALMRGESARRMELLELATKCLQQKDLNLMSVRDILDEILVDFPEIDDRLKADAKIVEPPNFETAVVKIMQCRERDLTSEESEASTRLLRFPDDGNLHLDCKAGHSNSKRKRTKSLSARTTGSTKKTQQVVAHAHCSIAVKPSRSRAK